MPQKIKVGQGMAFHSDPNVIHRQQPAPTPVAQSAHPLTQLPANIPILPLQQLWTVEKKDEFTTSGSTVTSNDVTTTHTGATALKAAAMAVIAFVGMQF